MIIVWPSLYESTSMAGGFGLFIPVYNGNPDAPSPVNNWTTYEIKVDWDGDGDFSEAAEDITANVKYIKFIRGFDQERGKAVSGRCELRVNNPTGTYTPSLHAEIKPGRLVQVSVTEAGIYVLYTGYVEEITPHPERKSQDCYITCLDGMDYLSRSIAKLPSKDVSTFNDDALILLLNAKWPLGACEIDGIHNVVPTIPDYYSGFDSGSVREALELLGVGVNGRVFVDRRGYLKFETREHRTLLHATPTFTFNESMILLQTTSNTRDVYNHVEIDAKSRLVGSRVAIWEWLSGSSDDPTKWIYIPAGTSYTFHATFDQEYTDVEFTYGLNIAPPGAVTQTVVNYGTSATCTLTYVSGEVYVMAVQAWGYPANIQSSKVVIDNTDSQDTYHKRDYSIPYCFLDAAGAEDRANEALEWLKDPHPDLTMTIVNRTPQLLSQILGQEISNRVRITNASLGLDNDYFIEYMEHEISISGRWHKVVYRLSQAGEPAFDAGAFDDAFYI
jgi:hypothetical protein